MENKKGQEKGKKPYVLCICDGWGLREETADNAIKQASTPSWDRFQRTYPHTSLGTSGADVGLPEGQMGNSEVGHMSIGSGRIILQDLPRIHDAIQKDQIRQNPVLIRSIESVMNHRGRFHVAGLLSEGGVHAHQDHLFHLLEILAETKQTVFVHAFLDGRDTPPCSALKPLKQLIEKIASYEHIHLASIMGRYYAMDRDKRWERISEAYHAMVKPSKEERVDDWCARIEKAYDDGITDEFMPPFVSKDYQGMEHGDGFLLTNFRADRARQIMHALVSPRWEHFSRAMQVHFSTVVGMMPYDDALKPYVQSIFDSEIVQHSFPEVISDAGLTQLRIAETEKYAHVTFFFSGGREELFEGEERVLIPSPRVATYDEKPEMSAYGLTERLVQEIHRGAYDVIIVNFANPDMVGHTGDMQAAKKAVEVIDRCLNKLEEAVLAMNGYMLITADHGNVEMMSDPITGEPHTAHTTNPVPLILVGRQLHHVALKSGRLADVAPTLLDLMGYEKPDVMTGKSLLIRNKEMNGKHE